MRSTCLISLDKQKNTKGIIATKPYVSSAAYIKRMGDHCSQCRYKPSVKIGSQACPFNALYWDFFARHAGAFERNPRLGMVYLQLFWLCAHASSWFELRGVLLV
jgi:deoxyribodipyrimidine photolyase-related protein